ncbi:hypothetical protein GCM10009682_00560 [Luedemannella flava]|uniref:Uncharacterized protein n=1 Tax=Luedemannella flava TaxID=349316 RepID=A0ABN2LBC7_9ACTN
MASRVAAGTRRPPHGHAAHHQIKRSPAANTDNTANGVPRVAAAGHSCGGLEALIAAQDSRVKSVVRSFVIGGGLASRPNWTVRGKNF